MINNSDKETINNDYQIYCTKILKNAIIILDNIQDKINTFDKKSDIYFNDIKKNNKLLRNEIDNYLLFLDYKNDKDNNFENIRQKLLKDCKNEFSNYSEIIYFINNFLNDIRNLMEEFNNKIDGLIDFSPPNINSFLDSINIDMDFKELSSSSFYDYNNYNKETLKCEICLANEATYICRDCYTFLCKVCYDKKLNNNKVHHFELIKKEEFEKIFQEENSEKKENSEKEEYNDINNQNNTNESINYKQLFLKSLEDTIKKIILMSNYLLEKGKIKLINNNKNNNNKNSKYIIRKINYPYINSINDFESNLTFLKDINSILTNEFKIEKVDINNFHFLEIQKELLSILENIFNDLQINTFKEGLKIIDNCFNTDESARYF